MKYKTELFAHQKDCLKRFGQKEYFALLAEMGTGKTCIIINNVADLYNQGRCDAMLVFAPNGVHTNWTRLEIPKHMPLEIPYHAAAWVAGGKKADYEDIEALYFKKRKQLRILTMNWEALQHNKGSEAAERFVLSSKKLMIVCDESDSIKNPKAKRTKRLLKLRKHCTWRRILSGTPVNNSPFDLFTQFLFLNESILETTSYYAFCAEYGEMLSPYNHLVQHIQKRTHFTPQIIARGVNGLPKYKNLDRLSYLIAPHSFRILKKDCLDLPEKIYKTVFFDMTKEQSIIYKKAEQECRLVFDETETAFDRLVALAKLGQITSGYYIHPAADEPVRIEGKTPKLDILLGRVQTILTGGESVIIWAKYRIEIEDITARLKEAKIKYVEYHGGIKKKIREEAIDKFEKKEVPVFVGNPQAGGLGITLVAASQVFYFSNSYSFRNRAQSEDRAHRIGQIKNVVYTNIAAKGTIDEIIIEALENKKNVAELVIDKGLELFK